MIIYLWLLLVLFMLSELTTSSILAISAELLQEIKKLYLFQIFVILAC